MYLCTFRHQKRNGIVLYVNWFCEGGQEIIDYLIYPDPKEEEVVLINHIEVYEHDLVNVSKENMPELWKG